ncbi:hypothetical protein GHV40_14210 [Devosia sp. D6-9]|nr:hypothetical protein GHV40_14210 [Devosia sp. D6-9]
MGINALVGVGKGEYWFGMSEVIEHILSPDKRMRITVRQRPDGCFECTLDKFYIDDLPEYDHYMEYWVTSHVWGIYDTALTAKRDASAEFPWVNESDSDR